MKATTVHHVSHVVAASPSKPDTSLIGERVTQPTKGARSVMGRHDVLGAAAWDSVSASAKPPWKDSSATYPNCWPRLSPNGPAMKVSNKQISTCWVSFGQCVLTSHKSSCRKSWCCNRQTCKPMRTRKTIVEPRRTTGSPGHGSGHGPSYRPGLDSGGRVHRQGHGKESWVGDRAGGATFVVRSWRRGGTTINLSCRRHSLTCRSGTGGD